MTEQKSCTVCGFLEGMCRLVRVCWDGSRLVVDTKGDGKRRTKYVCEDCIRAIKQFPFSDFKPVDVPF